jgi:hypothetical protein
MLHTSRQQIIVGLMVILLIFVTPQVGTATLGEEGQITIIIDFSHDQLFSPINRNFSQAIDYLQDYPEYFVRILQEGELTAENLSRSHILVIPNPGSNYSSSEQEVISNYVAHGGSLFLLGDYQVEGRQIGNPVALNEILQRLPEERIEFTTFVDGINTQGDTIIDSVNSIGIPYNIQINGSGFNTNFNRDLFAADINSIIIAAGSLTTDISDLLVSTGAETSKAVTINGQHINNQPGWLAAFEIGTSRIALCTSTTMFADTICAATNQSWFQSMDNSQLWSNIIRWISFPLLQDPTPIMIFFIVLALIAGIIVFVYVVWLKKRGR